MKEKRSVNLHWRIQLINLVCFLVCTAIGVSAGFSLYTTYNNELMSRQKRTTEIYCVLMEKCMNDVVKVSRQAISSEALQTALARIEASTGEEQAKARTSLQNAITFSIGELPSFVRSVMIRDVYGNDCFYSGLPLEQTIMEQMNAMIEAMKYWVSNTGIDGYRVDFVSSPVIGNDFWDQCIGALRALKPNIALMGEADFDTDENNHLFNAGAASGRFDYDYAWAFNDNVKEFGNSRNVATLLTACRTLVDNQHYDNMDRMVYLTNHDDGELDNGKVKVPNYISALGDNVTPLTVLEFTFYGMPLLFNGQEIGYPTQIDRKSVV